jgi:hypothetical protein
MRILLLALLLSACAPSPKDPTFYPDCSYKSDLTYVVHNFYHAVDIAPRANCVLAPDVGNYYDSVNLYSFELPNLQVGEEIRAYIQWEMTNDMPDNMMVAWFMVLSDSPDSWEGEVLTGSVGENISVNMHHAVYQAYAPFYFIKDPELKYLNLVVYGASDAHINGKHVIAEGKNSTIYIRRERD